MLKQLVVLCALISFVYGKSLVVGEIDDSTGQVTKIYERQFESIPIPGVQRVDELVFEYPVIRRKIKGISIKDLDDGLGEPSITEGGVGTSFVKIKLESERNFGYRFNIEVFALVD